MKYLGDKYIKAYNHYRSKQDEKISSLIIRVNELEKLCEWLCKQIIEGDGN